MYKKDKKEQISKPEKKGSQFLALSKMDNQKAHTEADREIEGGTVCRKSVTTFI